jgi:hypothetical protein
MPRKVRSKRSNKTRAGSSSDRWILDSDPGAVRALRQTSPLDLVIKPPIMTFRATPPVGFEKKPYFFKKQVSTTFTVASTGFSASALTFQLTDIADLVTLAGLFDQYCLFAVVVRFDPICSSASINGVLSSVIDFDNAAVPANAAVLQGYSTFMSMNVLPGSCQERMVKVCSTPLVYNGVGTSGFMVGQNWVDCVNTGVPHYGIRFGVDTNTSAYTIAIKSTYYVAFRNNI